jgi:hypothetical protein
MRRKSHSTVQTSTAAEAPSSPAPPLVRRVVALAPRAAHAADADNLVLGTGNASSAATTLTIGGDTGGVEPALALENADGPSLRCSRPHVGRSAHRRQLAGTERPPAELRWSTRSARRSALAGR